MIGSECILVNPKPFERYVFVHFLRFKICLACLLGRFTQQAFFWNFLYFHLGVGLLKSKLLVLVATLLSYYICTIISVLKTVCLTLSAMGGRRISEPQGLIVSAGVEGNEWL